MSDIEPIPCKKCKCVPKVVMINDLYYVQCTGFVEKKVNAKNLPKELRDTVKTVRVKCQKWGPHEFLGINRKSAIENWNRANSTHGTDEEDILW